MKTNVINAQFKYLTQLLVYQKTIHRAFGEWLVAQILTRKIPGNSEQRTKITIVHVLIIGVNTFLI